MTVYLCLSCAIISITVKCVLFLFVYVISFLSHLFLFCVCYVLTLYLISFYSLVLLFIVERLKINDEYTVHTLTVATVINTKTIDFCPLTQHENIYSCPNRMLHQNKPYEYTKPYNYSLTLYKYK